MPNSVPKSHCRSITIYTRLLHIDFYGDKRHANNLQVAERLFADNTRRRGNVCCSAEIFGSLLQCLLVRGLTIGFARTALQSHLQLMTFLSHRKKHRLNRSFSTCTSSPHFMKSSAWHWPTQTVLSGAAIYHGHYASASALTELAIIKELFLDGIFITTIIS